MEQNFNKELVLSRLNQIEMDDLISFLKEKKIELNEMEGSIATAKFEQLKRIHSEWLEQQLKIDQANKEAEYRKFVWQRHINSINNRDADYDENKIRELILNGSLSKTDLTDNTHLTEIDVNKILTNVEIDTGFDEWKDLPPLPDNRTDIYVFGIAGSGKSCLLAGVLFYGDKMGAVGLETQFVAPAGVRYKDELIRRVKLGILPQSTRADVLNYIPVPFYDKNNIPHPISFIEMSGEKFTRTYMDADVSEGIGARNYLSNDNQKIIMFVVDYNTNRTGLDHQLLATQSAQLEMTLSLLSRDGTLGKTHAVFVVVTKCDLLPEQQDVNRSVIHFLSTEYKGFLNNCKRMQEKHGFNLVVHPFSLGHFVLPKTYEYDEKYSKNIFEDIITFSFFETGRKKNGKSWFGF
jgi:hypothetical protein